MGACLVASFVGRLLSEGASLSKSSFARSKSSVGTQKGVLGPGLTAKNREQLRNPTLGSRVWARFAYFSRPEIPKFG